MYNLNIQDGLAKLLNGKRKTFPCHVNRISQLDDPCLRRLYYRRHDWDKATPVDTGLMGIFETGNLLESVIERIVSEAGYASDTPWRIVGSQTTTKDSLLEKYQISGTCDGFLQVKTDDGEWITLGAIDIKTMSPNVFAQIHDYADLQRYPWTAKYRGQVMLYSLAHNLDRCFLLLVNKSNLFDMRLIDFPLDMEYCERLLGKAQAVNEAIEASVAPVGINHPDECRRCPFCAFCAPPLATGGNLQILDNDELASILDRLDQLSGESKEISDLEAARDRLLAKGQDVVCGRWLVTWSKIIVNRKASAASTVEQWRKKIVSTAPAATPA